MSQPIFSPPAAVTVGASSLPLRRADQPGHRQLMPGERLIDGRIFYSAAWLDQATGTHPKPPPGTPARGAVASDARLTRGD